MKKLFLILFFIPLFGIGQTISLNNNNITCSDSSLTVKGNITADTLEGYYEIGYKVYAALLTQTGTSDPSATVLTNTLGEVPTYAYVSAGRYELNITGTLFLQNKTAVWFGASRNSSGVVEMLYDGSSKITIYTRDLAGSAIDEVLNYTYIEVRVYP
jgi:hypothetical protein